MSLCALAAASCVCLSELFVEAEISTLPQTPKASANMIVNAIISFVPNRNTHLPE